MHLGKEAVGLGGGGHRGSGAVVDEALEGGGGEELPQEGAVPLGLRGREGPRPERLLLVPREVFPAPKRGRGPLRESRVGCSAARRHCKPLPPFMRNPNYKKPTFIRNLEPQGEQALLGGQSLRLPQKRSKHRLVGLLV